MAAAGSCGSGNAEDHGAALTAGELWRDELHARRAAGGDLYFHRPRPPVLQLWQRSGDYGDIKFNDKHMDNPHSGTTSVQIVYTNAATQGARWAGIYWQNPPNNWGTRPGGYDLTGAKKLTFWARGEKGGERIEEFKIGGITGEYADSDVAGIGPVVLTTEWQQFTIDLEGKDLSSISGGFCWATNLDVNPDGATFYLDSIRYE